MKNVINLFAPRSRWLLAALAMASAFALAACHSTSTKKSAATDYYSCGMHPEVRAVDPDARCPLCQMQLFPASTIEVTDPDTGRSFNAGTFPAVSGWRSCPMHHTVLSREATDKCPVCGMELLPVENPVFHHNHK